MPNEKNGRKKSCGFSFFLAGRLSAAVPPAEDTRMETCNIIIE